MNVLKNASLSYVQNMIEIMILASYSDKSWLVASSDEFVASTQIMSHDRSQVETPGKSKIFIARHGEYSTGFLPGIFFRGGGQNLLLCKFILLY